MKLIVGLGNPGKKYAKNRHNVGFRVVDALEKEISSPDIILLKPDTFMNNSGKAVLKLANKYRLSPTQIWVIHDEIDLPFGKIRVSKDSSSAGHKGIKSIIDELGTKEFNRLRIGIKPQYNIDTTDFVLKNFTEKEEKELKEIIKKAVFEITQLL